MPLPDLDKAYSFAHVNQAHTASGVILTDCQVVMLAIKNSLKGYALLPWTVLGSGNGAGGFGLDAVDRWATAANLVWAGGAHSWIVLRQSALSNVQICIDLNSASPYQCTVVMSNAGFTGGSNTARPTATDEVILATNVQWHPAASANVKFHVIHSTDGEVNHIVIYSASVLVSFWHFSKAKNPITAWASPTVCLVSGSSGLSVAGLYTSAAARTILVGAVSLFMTGEATQGSLIVVAQTFVDDNSLEWPFCPIGLWSATALNRGRKGALFDLWWGAAANQQGDRYPDVPDSATFVQFDDVIFPWIGDGTPPLIV